MQRHRLLISFAVIGILIISYLWWNTGQNIYEVDQPITAEPSDCQSDLRFVIIGVSM